jgi:hypothetical protein
MEFSPGLLMRPFYPVERYEKNRGESVIQKSDSPGKYF